MGIGHVRFHTTRTSIFTAMGAQISADKRRVKVQARCVESGRYRYIRPELRLCGKWLEELGFSNGKVVTVVCCEKKLVITVE